MENMNTVVRGIDDIGADWARNKTFENMFIRRIL